MRRVPWLTLLVIWLLAFSSTGLPFSHAEPFETWSGGFQAILPAAIFSIGLLPPCSCRRDIATTAVRREPC